MLKTTLAERILKSAAQGERNRERLREAALMHLAAWWQQNGFASLPHGRKDLPMPRLEIAAPLYRLQSSNHVGGRFGLLVGSV